MTRRPVTAPTLQRRRDDARRPFVLRPRQRAATAVASVVVSCVLLSVVGFGMTSSSAA